MRVEQQSTITFKAELRDGSTEFMFSRVAEAGEYVNLREEVRSVAAERADRDDFNARRMVRGERARTDLVLAARKVGSETVDVDEVSTSTASREANGKAR